jgi:predicted DNA-binding protein (UPF0251 family)
VRDARRDTVLSLILEWDHTVNAIHDHLGMTIEQWDAFRSRGELARDYKPREPAETLADPRRQGRTPGRKNLDAAERETIRVLNRQGMSQHRIAEEIGATQSTVQRILKQSKGAR